MPEPIIARVDQGFLQIIPPGLPNDHSWGRASAIADAVLLFEPTRMNCV